MGRKCGTFEGDEKCTDRIRGIDVDVGVMLRILVEREVWCELWTGCIWLRLRSCEGMM
jgi:hypothetical protein